MTEPSEVEEGYEIEEPQVEEPNVEEAEQEELEEIPLRGVAALLGVALEEAIESEIGVFHAEQVLVGVLVRDSEGNQRYAWRSMDPGWAGTLAIAERIAFELKT